MIRVLIAEDMHMIRGALTALLGLEEDMEVVAELDRGDQILDAALRTRPDVAVLDIGLPGIDGLTAAGHLHEALPECRTLILTGMTRPGNLLRALKTGVRGFIPKDAPAETLAVSIRQVAAGQRVIDPDLVAAALETGASPLTPPGDRRPTRGRERHLHREHRHPARAGTRDRSKLPVQRHQQDRRPQPHRRHPHRPGRRLAVTGRHPPVDTPATSAAPPLCPRFSPSGLC
jgi:two-component system response regulator DesR